MACQRQSCEILQFPRTFPGELTCLCTSRHVRFFFSTAKGELISAPTRDFNQKSTNPLETSVYCVFKLLGVCCQWQRTGNGSDGRGETPGWLPMSPQEVALFLKKWLNSRFVCESHPDLSQPSTSGLARQQVSPFSLNIKASPRL